MNSNLTIVIPCYNEEENIPVFFPKLQEFVKKHNFQVIAVNDGSKDNTLQELQKFAVLSARRIIERRIRRVKY